MLLSKFGGEEGISKVIKGDIKDAQGKHQHHRSADI